MELIKFIRVEQWLQAHGLSPFAKLVQLLSFILFSSDVPVRCEIGQGTYFGHRGLGVLLVAGTKIGKNCCIGVGCKTVRKFPFKEVAEIDDEVYLGPGCVIVGPVKIGKRVIIAANAVVTKSVPDYAVVGGIPAKVIGSTRDLDYDPFKNPQHMAGWAPHMVSEA